MTGPEAGQAVFARADFARLALALSGLQGRFILSINDVPEIRETFAGFDIETVETTYTLNNGAPQGGRKELLITEPQGMDAADIRSV